MTRANRHFVRVAEEVSGIIRECRARPPDGSSPPCRRRPMTPLQRIAIKPSPWLAAALCAIHAAAAATLWLVPGSVWLKAGLTLALALSLAHALARKAALQGSRAIVALEVTQDGRISYRTRGGDWPSCELLGSSYVSPWLTILNLKPGGGRRVRHVVLVPDNINERDFRRFRTWLRWAVQPQAGHTQ